MIGHDICEGNHCFGPVLSCMINETPGHLSELLSISQLLCSVFIQIPKKAMPKNVQTNTVVLISHASKVMLKIPHARLQKYVNQELPEV